MCDLTFVILWNSLHDVGTFGFAPGRQLKSFWLVRFRTGRATLLVSWLGAWSDAMTGASIARPWTSLPRCNRTFLPWPYNLFCLEACTLHRGQRVSFRSWKHTFEDYSIWFGSIWPSWHLARQHLIVMASSDLGRLDDRCVDCSASTSLPRFDRTFLPWPYNVFFWKCVRYMGVKVGQKRVRNRSETGQKRVRNRSETAR